MNYSVGIQDIPGLNQRLGNDRFFVQKKISKLIFLLDFLFLVLVHLKYLMKITLTNFYHHYLQIYSTGRL